MSEPPEASPAPAAFRRSHHAQPWNATSAAAWWGEVPAEDDPLLAFAPYVHKAPKRTSITPDLQRAFVAVLAATGIVSQAARSIGKSMEALYALRKKPGAQGFAAAWDEAARWGIDRIEDCALERVLNGIESALPPGRGDALLIQLLRTRTGFRVDERDVVPGHPLYERIRAEVLAEKSQPCAPASAGPASGA